MRLAPSGPVCTGRLPVLAEQAGGRIELAVANELVTRPEDSKRCRWADLASERWPVEHDHSSPGEAGLKPWTILWSCGVPNAFGAAALRDGQRQSTYSGERRNRIGRDPLVRRTRRCIGCLHGGPAKEKGTRHHNDERTVAYKRWDGCIEGGPHAGCGFRCHTVAASPACGRVMSVAR